MIAKYFIPQCLPGQRHWPAERCQRCVEKDFVCSAPTRAGPAKLSSSTMESPLNAPSGTPPELEDVDSVEDLWFTQDEHSSPSE